MIHKLIVSAMVRNYKRKTNQRAYGRDGLQKALDAVKSGVSFRQASRDFSIPRKTLQRHAKRNVRSPGHLGRFRNVFSGEVKKELLVLTPSSLSLSTQ